MQHNDTPQLPLPLLPRIQLGWNNFVVGNNEIVVNSVRELNTAHASAKSIYIAGPSGAGKSHLLFAVLNQLIEASEQSTVQYLDLQQAGSDYQSIAHIQPKAINLLDNVDSLAGDAESERALFGLIERIRQSESMFIATAKTGLEHSSFELIDLVSRLQAGLYYSLREMDDEQTQKAIALRFKTMGLAVSDAITHYILTRLPRNKHELFAALDDLDEAALKAQRKITIPFIRATLHVR